MPEPISSSASSPQTSSLSSDPTLDQVGQLCRSDAPNGSLPAPAVSTPPAVGKLISAVPPPASALPPASPAAPPMAQNNAQRTAELSGIAPYAAAGITGDFGDSAYAGVAALKGHDPKTGLDLEVFSASAQVGLQNEVQVGMARMGVSGRHGGITAEFFTARANEGIHNDDSSTGLNAGALAAGAGIEGTLVSGAGSFTFGLTAGGGEAASVGLRDIDADGKPEVCFKAAFGPITVGFCSED